MLILLPPSETKRDGGDGAPLETGSLRFPRLRPVRSRAVRALAELARDPEATARALKLGPRQLAEVERNRRLRTAPTMPALDRYTGVLYDALDAGSLSAPAREFAAQRVLIHSALFGLVGPLDGIPAYRLSHDSRVPGLPLRELWAAPLAEVLSQASGLVLDLRSEGYVKLGPAPLAALRLRVVTRDASGERRALNHFNKRSKGLLTRALVEDGVDHPDVSSLCAWAGLRGFELSVRDGALELVVAPDAVHA